MKPKSLRLKPGDTFADLTIIESAGSNKWGKGLWKCRCKCGTEWVAITGAIVSGSTKRCQPCGRKAVGDKLRGSRSPNCIDLTGRTFGKLLALRYHDFHDHKARWECVCDCGTKSFVTSSQLLQGKTKSCGCLKFGTREVESKPYRARQPRREREFEVSPWSKSTPTYMHINKTDEAGPVDNKTALIIASRRTFTKWPEIAELVGLPVEECKRRMA